MKRMLKYILFFTFLCLFFSSSLGLEIIEQNYQYKTITTDGLNRISVVVFSVKFSESVGVSGVPVAELAQDETTSEVMLSLFGINSPLPMSTAALLGIATLECSDQVFTSVPLAWSTATNSSLLTEEWLIPVPPTDDPALAFFNSFHVDGSSNFFLDLPALDGWFSAMLFLQDNRECDPFVGCQFDSGLAPRLTDTDFATCKLSFGLGYPLADSDPAPYLYGLSSPSDPFVSVSVSNFTEKQLPECTLPSLINATDNYQAATLAISGSNFPGLVGSFWRAIMFGIADPILSCQNFLNLLLNDTIYLGNATTELCTLAPDDPAYYEDPCCDAALRYGDQCCAARPQNFSFPAYALKDHARQLLRQLGCHEAGFLESSIEDWILSLADNANPLTGCSASARSLASEAVFASYFDFVSTCFDVLQNDPPPCEKPTDCPYTNVCFSQVCGEAADSYEGGHAFTLCFVDYMPPTISGILKLYLNLSPNATYDDFVSSIEDVFWAPNCLSYIYSELMLVPSSTSLLGFDYVTYTKDECDALGGEACLYDSLLSYTECMSVKAYTSSEYVCAQCYGEYCTNMYIPPRCVYTGFDQATCEALGGIWDIEFGSFDPCTIPGITTQEECLPPAFCPPEPVGANAIKSYCGDSYCYRPDITREQDCVGTCTTPLRWANTSAGGVCKTSDTSASDCYTISGGEWFIGKSWWSPIYDTEESCTAGICGGGGFIYVGTSGENCTQTDSDYTCTQRCSMCSAFYEGSYLCSDPAITTECDCTSITGTWINSLSKCIVNFLSKSQCISNNYTLFECSQYKTVDDCRSCTDLECSFLGCFWDFDAPCRSESQCLEFGGGCSDRDYVESTRQECDIYYRSDRPDYCFTACLFPPDIDADGLPYCSQGDAVGSGCVVDSIDDPTACHNAGGRIINKTVTQDQCLSAAVGCYEPEFDPFFTGKDETQCDNCLASYEPQWTFDEPVWAPYGRLPLYWKPVAWGPWFPYGPTMNYTKFEEVVSVAAITRTRLSLQSEAQCLLNPLHSLLKLLTCDCTNVTRNDYKTICKADTNGVRTIPTGATLLCSGADDATKIGGFTLLYSPDTVPEEYGCIQVTIESVPALQFKAPQQSTLSSLSLSSAASKRVDNEYAIVENKYGRQIGQIMTNGLSITFSLLDINNETLPTQKRAVAVRDTTIILNNLTVCFDRSTDITLSKANFPWLDFSYYRNGHFFPMFTNTTDGFSETTGRQYFCSTLSQDGIYFPIYRVTDPNQDTSLYSDTEKGFIFTVAALFLIGFIIVIILICLTFYVHGFKGFCINLFKGKQLAVMILCLLLVFSGLRGIWLCLAGAEVLGPNSSLALDAVLTDLPIYIFFTLFMLLIFFWAELYHFQFKRKNSVLGRLRIPFILVNVFIYVFFTVIVIIFSQSDSTQQPTVELVYKCIVASIGFIILISFMFYGGLLMLKSRHASRASGGGASDQFIRMTIITGTCSVASLVQFIFLLLFAFTSIENVVSILVYLFVVEVIPMYLLLWMFFQPKRLNETLTTSYGSGRVARRSLPGSSRSRQSKQGSGTGSSGSKGSSSTLS